jgi:hypothetical protein
MSGKHMKNREKEGIPPKKVPERSEGSTQGLESANMKRVRTDREDDPRLFGEVKRDGARGKKALNYLEIEQRGEELGTTIRVGVKSSVPCWKVTTEEEISENESKTENQ